MFIVSIFILMLVIARATACLQKLQFLVKYFISAVNVLAMKRDHKLGLYLDVDLITLFGE